MSDGLTQRSDGQTKSIEDQEARFLAERQFSPSAIANEVVNGHMSPAEGWVVLHSIKQDLEAAMESIKEAARIELAKYGKEGYVAAGKRVIVRQGKRSFSYKHYQGWADLSSEIKGIEEKMKAAAASGMEGGITLDGEVIPPAKITYATDTIYVEEIK